MDLQEFEAQMGRLRETYGDRAYPDERVKVFWKVFRHLPDGRFARAVGRAIASRRMAPMLDELSEALASLGEDSRTRDAIDARQEAEAALSGDQFNDEEARAKFKFIVDRMKGRVNDKEWAVFQEALAPKKR